MALEKTCRHWLRNPRDLRVRMRVANCIHQWKPVDDVAEPREEHDAEMRRAGVLAISHVAKSCREKYSLCFVEHAIEREPVANAVGRFVYPLVDKLRLSPKKVRNLRDAFGER